MAIHLERRWRVFQSGLSFAVFGGVMLALAFVVIPIGRRFTRNREADDLRAQRWIHHGCRVFVAFMRGIGLMRLDRVGVDRLRAGGPLLVVANHPTLFDLPVILSLMPQADCIVGAERAENFFLRRVVAAAGYARNDDGASVIRACLRRLASGRSVVIFPEGTRSRAGGLGAFWPGAAFVALRSGHDLVPVLIRCEPSTLAKGRSWYDAPAGQLHVRVCVGEPVPAQPLRYRGVDLAEAARRLTAELREVFLKGLDIADVGSA